MVSVASHQKDPAILPSLLLLLVRPLLKVFSLFGFPFVVSSEDSHVQFVPTQAPTFRLLGTLVLSVLSTVILIYRSDQKGILFDAEHLQKTVGISLVDLTLYKFMECVPLAGVTTAFFVLRGRRQRLEEVANTLTDNFLVPDHRYSRGVRSRMLVMVICEVLSCFSLMGFVTQFYDLALHDDQFAHNYTLKVIFSITVSSMIYFGIFHPVLLGSSIISTLFLYALRGCYEEMTGRTKEAIRGITTLTTARASAQAIPMTLEERKNCPERQKARSTSLIAKKSEELVRKCLILCDLQSEMNEVLAPMIMVEISFALVTGVISCYGEGSNFFGPMTTARIYAGVFFFVCIIALFTMAFLTFNAGQRIKDARECLRVTLTKFKSVVYDNMDELQRVDMETLNDRLVNPETPISPYGFFYLSHSGLMSSFVTIMTYMIVLLQFKQGSK